MYEKRDWRVGVNVRKEGLEGWSKCKKEGLEGWSKCMKRGIGGLE